MSLDAVIKGIAQSGPAGRSFLPTEPVALLLFALSSLGAAGAFGMIHWSYVRPSRASMMGASYSVAYVALPLLVGAVTPRRGEGATRAVMRGVPVYASPPQNRIPT